ncbi:cyclodeaminase/cyclohydrolase family protein [Actinophytocola oryzae]|uniref:Formiminotetrahydrofolate cyclodeaminase n=1 Tax=Actinophytocola oryzae TaxID=502181 RepID=A0A4V3FU46_9PSEU|nr:cyclodeaminase/cyclohydrolase family protein [Actinophytocola oryzae]TDV53731.1 formiminotetrahydrofolate cyclodeaminase [Actinophytocola oryzae]
MRSFLEEVAARTPAPGGGAVAAMTGASAAALVSMAARFSASDEVATAGDGLRARLVQLAADDAAAYTAVLAARGEARRQAMRVATEVPREIAAVALEVAALAHALVATGNPNLTGDARVAELLAEAAAKAAGVLVDINTA